MKSDTWAPPYSQNGMIITPPRIFDCEIGRRIRFLSKHRIVDYLWSPLHWTKKCSSNQIVWSDDYDCLSCKRMYLHTSMCSVCTDVMRHQCSTLSIADQAGMDGFIVTLCTLYCNVFSPVNETWGGNFSWWRWLVSGLPVRVHVLCWRCGFGEWFAWRVISCAF